jgi:peptidoglycan-associated lipoprotein
MAQCGKNLRHAAIFLGVMVAIVTTSSCAHKQPTTETSPSADMNAATTDSDKTMGPPIHFSYESFLLSEEAKTQLRATSDILKNKTSVKIQIEGNCDQRGGIQYNVALGEKRANSVKRYLEDLGVAGDRIATISFGKEHPIDLGTSEEAYAKNRRADIVITSR